MLEINHMNKQSGMGLVELMIGSLVGLIIVAGVLVMYTATVKGSATTLRAAKLNQELSAAMSVMTRDIRRAGHWFNVQADDEDNPFSRMGTTNISIQDNGSNVAGCILYSYDRIAGDGSTAVPAVFGIDLFGFKLENEQIFMHTGGTSLTNNCANGTWEAITDNNIIKITALSFSTLNSKCLNSSSTADPQANWRVTSSTATTFPCDKSTVTTTGYSAALNDVLLETRQVNIVLTGELRSTGTSLKVTKSLQESVRVRNDRVSLAAAP